MTPAAIGAIAQDLQYALAYSNSQLAVSGLSFMMRPDRGNITSYKFLNSEINFVALQGKASKSDGQRGTRCIYYWIREATANDNGTGAGKGTYELMRTELTASRPALVTPPAIYDTALMVTVPYR